MLKKSLAVTLYTVRDFCKTLPDIVDTLKKISSIGYQAVQLSGFGPVDFKELGKVISDTGLVVAATHVGWSRLLNELDIVIEEHKFWNCKHSAVGCLPEEYHNLDGLKRFIDEVYPVAEKLKKAGIDFSYHNHSHEFVRYENKTWLEMLYDKTTPEILNAEIDTYWIQHGGGDPAQWIRRCSGRQPLLHLKDMAIVPPAEQRFAAVGQGNLDWPAILKSAAQSGVQWYIVEQDDCYGQDPFEELAASYRNLLKMGFE